MVPGRLLAATAVAFAIASLATGAEGVPAPLQTGFETSLVKVFPADTALASQAAEEGEITLAGNEYEALQLLVTARRDLAEVTVEVSDLESQPGVSIPSSDIFVNAVGYVPVIEPFYEPYYVRLPNQPAWPDPLLPRAAASVKAGTVQSFWITVYAAAGTPPGIYRGTVTVSCDGLATAEAALSVRVRDFTLPERYSLKTCFWLYPRYIREYHGFESRESPGYAEMIIKYLDTMLDHGMSHADISYDAPAPQVEMAPGVEPDFSEWDAWMQRWIDRGQSFFTLPIHRDDSREVITLKAQRWGAHLKEKGWLDIGCAFMHDETTEGKEQRAWVHEGHSELRNALTWHPVPECPNVDIWMPQVERGYAMYPASVAWARREGREIWIYSSSPATGPNPEKTAFYPNTNIDFPATHCRLLPWVCWREDFAGYLYWCVNHWAKNPWETAETFRNQNGNGSFFYPGEDGPVASLRAKAFRDGMEDYEYFRILKERAQAAREAGVLDDLAAQAGGALRLWAETRAFMYEVNRRPQRLYEIRERIADLIESLSPTAIEAALSASPAAPAGQP